MHTSQKGFSLNYGIVMLMIVNDGCELKSVEKLVKQTAQALGCVQTGATTPNKSGTAVHRGKNTVNSL